MSSLFCCENLFFPPNTPNTPLRHLLLSNGLPPFPLNCYCSIVSNAPKLSRCIFHLWSDFLCKTFPVANHFILSVLHFGNNFWVFFLVFKIAVFLIRHWQHGSEVWALDRFGYYHHFILSLSLHLSLPLSVFSFSCLWQRDDGSKVWASDRSGYLSHSAPSSGHQFG